MTRPIRVLIVEDKADDAELVADELRRGGFEPTCRRVETESEYLKELQAFPDVILADATLSRFSASRALELLKQSDRDVPLIVLTGGVSAETAVEHIKQGAEDYILRDRMARLPAAVGRALKEKTLREEARRAEAAFHAIEARKGAILESALDCIITMDHQGKIIEFNPAAERTFGYNRAEVVGKEMGELIIPPSLRERHRRGLAHYLATGEGPVLDKRIEITAIRANGSEFPAELSIIRIPRTEPPMFTGFVRDITDRKRAEEDLRESEQRFRLLVEGVKDYSILMLDPWGFVTTWNEGAERIEGYRAEEIIGQHMSRFYTAGDVARGYPARLLKIARAEGRVEDEGLRVRKDGTQYWANVIISALWDAQGELRGFAKVKRDLTERKQSEERLQRYLKQETTLREVQNVMSLTLDLNSSLDLLLEKADQLVPNTVCAVRLLNTTTGKLELAACRNHDLQDWRAVFAEGGEGITRMVFETRTPVVIGSGFKDPRIRHPEMWIEHGIKSYAVIPLVAKGEVLGVISFLSGQPKFSDDEIDFLITVACQVSIAIHNAQLHDEITKQAAMLEIVNQELEARVHEQFIVSQVSQIALQSNDLSLLFNETVRLIAQTLNVKYSKIMEILPDGDTLLLVAGAGWEKDSIGRAIVKAGLHSQCGFTLLSNGLVIVEDLATETRFRPPPLLLEHNVASGMTVTIHDQERIFGVLGVDADEPRRFSENEIHFLQAVANILGTAIQRNRMEKRLRDYAERLHRLSQRLLEVQETERRSLAWELHDEIGQALTAVKINLQTIGNLADVRAVKDRLVDSISLIDNSIDQVRNMSHNLRPSILDDLGLVPALRWYVDRQAQRAGLTPELRLADLKKRLASKIETVCFRVVQEALTNVLRHTRATKFQVELREHDDKIDLIVKDDGIGFDVVQATEKAAAGESFGLLGMKERVHLVGGTLEVNSSDGAGTEIRASLPKKFRDLKEAKGK